MCSPKPPVCALARLGDYQARMLDQTAKLKIIKKFQTREGDTGSSEVQIALLTYEINELIEHLKQHRKDHSSRRGLLRKVGQRRRLMRYLQRENKKSYDELVKKLKLKSAKTLEEVKEEDKLLEEDANHEHAES